MTFRLPEDWKDDKHAYEKIEMYGKRGGQYPMGRNHCWHSGVHVYGGKPVYPIINGTIVACRLTNSFAVIPRLKILSGNGKESLNESEHFLYEKIEPANLYSNWKLKPEYEQIDEELFNSLTEKQKEWFEKEGEVYKPVEKVSTEYILVKHEENFPEYNRPRETITFFTLYMGLYTFNKEYKDYYDGFTPVPSFISGKELPVFQKWVIRLNNTPNKNFKVYDRYKVFEYSTCSFELNAKDQSKYDCKFYNDPDYGLEQVETIYIEPTSVQRYKAKEEMAPVYKIPKSGDTRGIPTTTVKKGSEFGLVEKWSNNSDYYKVIVWEKDINPSSLCGWFLATQEQKGSGIPFPLEERQLVYTIRFVTDGMPDHCCVSNGRNYYQMAGASLNSIPSEHLEQIVIIQRKGVNPVNIHYTFYRGRNKIKLIEVNDRDFERLNRISDTSILSSILIYQWRQVQDFERGDHVRIESNISEPVNSLNAEINKLPLFVINQESISFCRFSYTRDKLEHNALMHKDNLMPIKGFGYLNSQSVNNFLDEPMKGCIIYDYIEAGTPVNARAFIGEAEIFESDAPYALFEDYHSRKPLRVTFKDNNANRQGFLIIDRGVTVNTKLEMLRQ